MSNETCVKIEIIKKVPFFGDAEDTLEKRLRNVTLRGFPEVKIYQNATFQLDFYSPERIKNEIHTPQLRVYRTHLDKVKKLHELFLEKDINILNLDQAYDFLATSESGKITEWTMMPPITEVYQIPKGENGKLDYATLIGQELRSVLDEANLGINAQVLELDHTSQDGWFNQINDGSHRVHYGYENGGVKIIKAKNMVPGYPYYSAPQEYNIEVFATREEAISLAETKIHVVDSPGHKDLYRLFPTGNIKSGEVRSDPKLGGISG